jgi:hypothetical protein
MSTDTKWIVVGGGVFYLSGYSEFSGSPSWAFTERQALHFTTEQEATDESAKWTAQLNQTFTPVLGTPAGAGWRQHHPRRVLVLAV